MDVVAVRAKGRPVVIFGVRWDTEASSVHHEPLDVSSFEVLRPERDDYPIG